MKLDEEGQRPGRPILGIQTNFLHGHGGAGFRITFPDDPQGTCIQDGAGIRFALDSESRDRLLVP